MEAVSGDDVVDDDDEVRSLGGLGKGPEESYYAEEIDAIQSACVPIGEFIGCVCAFMCICASLKFGKVQLVRYTPSRLLYLTI